MKQAVCIIALLAISACSGSRSSNANATDAIDAAPEPVFPACEAQADAPSPLPGVKPEHLTLDYWLKRLAEDHDVDETLLTPEQIDRFNAANGIPREGYHPQRDLLVELDLVEMTEEVDKRNKWLLGKLGDGSYLQSDGQPVPEDQLTAYHAKVALDDATPELRVAIEEIPIRCGPRPEPIFSRSLDLRFDRNACSTIRQQEVVQMIAAWPNGTWLIRTRYAFGWITPGDALSPPIPPEFSETFVRAPRVQLMRDHTISVDGGASVTVKTGALLPPAEPFGKKRPARQLYIASQTGFHKTEPLDKDLLRFTRRDLTRRAVLEELWRYMDSPFGLGGVRGGRDCSRMLLDTFETFDLRLPRHSSWQSHAGSFWIDIDKELPEADRMLMIDAAARKGVVLLHFPGHIMFYLGKNDDGEPMVYHAFAEYLEGCPGRESLRGTDTDVHTDTTRKVDVVTVSNLELGRDSSRTAFIERISRITVIGEPPGLELIGVAEMRPAGPVEVPRKCRSKGRLHFSPERPNKNEPLRVIAVTRRDPGPVAMTLIDPSGQRHQPDVARLGGPPFGMIATIERPAAGRWTAVLGDGDNVLACRKIGVRSRRGRISEEDPAGPIWKPRRKWGITYENLYALFVERLLDYSIEEDRVWPNMHSLTRDPGHNFLHNHRGLDEDDQLTLVPDCADLPYTMRAYFAWKMRLPFGYRRCKRARSGRPPDCTEEGGDDNLMSRLELGNSRKKPKLEEHGDLKAFDLFIKTRVMRAVHSSSGRTLPDIEETDFYPVPLTREALRPGTVFFDPYGHVLTIADWIPQGAGDKYGILVGVDAQPDGTVGRRRFWRGSFLFHPETDAGGAGFKAFRPRMYTEEPTEVTLEREDQPEPTVISRIGYAEELDNESLERSRRFPRLSMQQYKGSQDRFYETMERLINPRPLDPVAMQGALLDALHESARRRVNSVNNGEAFMTENNDQPMDMPEGARIFLAADPWESFSTPSRDLRLLISIDTVTGFPDVVARSPERFGVKPGADADKAVARVRKALDEGLKSRTLTYTRSDGSEKQLTLADLVARQTGFEMAYNPNDCVEIRWAAPDGSDELSTCDRHAPAEHRARMERYRSWFTTRKRPAN